MKNGRTEPLCGSALPSHRLIHIYRGPVAYRKNEKKNDAMISTIPPPTRLESCA